MIIRNIGAIIGLDTSGPLRGHEMDNTRRLCDAWLRVDNGVVNSYGTTETCPAAFPGEEVIDAHGALVLPSFADSHTHIVYPESRAGEFLDKINGLSYEQIAARGGGILNSADKVGLMSEQNLYEVSVARAREVMAMGTGAIEIKSGYGLSLPSELKMLRVIARMADTLPITVKATFLGAHAVGRRFAGRQDDYVRHIVDDMLPAVAAEGLARYVDVFCDRGFFTPAQTAMILEAAAKYGMQPKIHANELDVSGGVEVGVQYNALSVDHLERAGQAQLELLASTDTAATMLPGASFFLGMPYGDARQAIDTGCILALASDFNPGSSPSGDMRFVWALACIRMRLTPIQAFNAVTVNGAYAMGLSGSHGTISAGNPANIIITLPPDSNGNDPMGMLTEIPYRYTRPWIKTVLAAGQIVS